MKETSELLKKVLDNPSLLETVSKEQPLLDMIRQHVEAQKKTNKEVKPEGELIKDIMGMINKL